VQIDWTGFYSHQRRDRLPLPTYPFERQRYWIELQQQTQVVAISQAGSPEHFQGGEAQEYQLPTNSKMRSELSLHSRPHLRNSYIAPSNELENKISSFYQQLLGIEQVGIYDNFFELGGNSLIGIQVIAQLRNNFQLELSLRALFEAPSVAELALFIEEMILAELEELSEDEAFELLSVFTKKEQALITLSQQSILS
jgi:phthiocerol/phenolphthiocerol synthesis type-I polyketide synthase E